MLLCISGSLRKASTNRLLLAEAALHYGGDHEDADLHLPLYDGDLEDAEGVPPAVLALRDQIAAAEAVVISGPEYNQSLSGVLKNALDWVSRTEDNPWLNKPVAIMSAAAGRSGGARGVYAMRLALAPFRPRFSSGPEVLLAASFSAFDDAGKLKAESTDQLLDEAMATLRSEAQG